MLILLVLISAAFDKVSNKLKYVEDAIQSPLSFTAVAVNETFIWSPALVGFFTYEIAIQPLSLFPNSFKSYVVTLAGYPNSLSPCVNIHYSDAESHSSFL